MEKYDIADYVKNKHVVLVGYPGAFTGPCQEMLPTYLENASKIKAQGVDEILALSVNDPFVMKAWGDQNNVGNKIQMLGDPFCEFTKLMGLEIDKSAKGLGIRSSRYTMLVDEGKIKKISVEQDTGECKISSAENFLKEI